MVAVSACGGRNFANSGGLSNPYGVVFGGSDGNLYVSSYSTNDVKRYDATTGALVQPNPFASGGGLTKPTYLTWITVAL
jgi:hypothetical protein